MCQPGSNHPRAGWLWAADNGCFADRWNVDRWRAWLNLDHPRAGCLFAVVPDVVADHAATLERFGQHVDTIRAARYPVAFALQDGATVAGVPWSEIDVVFVGGSTDWKFSEQARALAREAHAAGLWVHAARLNSRRRLRAWAIADSADGTFLRYAPAKNVRRLDAWLADADRQEQLAL